MSIKKFTCDYCGTDDPHDAKEYDGMLGYEAILCRKCGATYDLNGSHPPSENGCKFVGIPFKSYKPVNREKALEKVAVIESTLVLMDMKGIDHKKVVKDLQDHIDTLKDMLKM